MAEEQARSAYRKNPALANKWGIYFPEAEIPRSIGACPECGSGAIQIVGGCPLCLSCGWSACN